MTTPQQANNGFGGVPSGVPQGGQPGGYPPQGPGGQVPPGPYGSQGPYGAPPQGPYGVPQQVPYGYGGPGMVPQPPQAPRSNTGKILGIVGAVVGVLVLGGVASAVLLGGGGSGGGSKQSAGPKYRITVPQSLVGGKYSLAKDISSMADGQVPHDGVNAHGMRSAGGQYTGGTTSLVMMGIYGTIDDPEEGVNHMIHGLTSSPDVDVVVSDKKFTPSGGGDPLSCGVEVKSTAGQKITLPFCVWGTSSTTVSVAKTDAADLGKDPRSVDLQAFADDASRIRTEVQVPAAG
ncbi:hypothetical protein ACF082_17545 [Streptomyces lydicus]|uniref:hypothetical protein n=1 Tax=Streptomyces lydicus TaxID=47763 RepID=UPI0036FC3855